MLTIAIKTFQELGAQELYELLQLRSEVFVVEQHCVYQDLDGKDSIALHIVGTKNGKIVAYTRIFRPGDYMDKASIGRVVVKVSERQHGYGLDIMKASIDAIHQHFQETVISLSAQSYLKKFYNSLEFQAVGEGYLEDGIPHIKMVRHLK